MYHAEAHTVVCYLGHLDEPDHTGLNDLAVTVTVMAGVRSVYADARHLCWVSGPRPPAPWTVAGIEFGTGHSGAESKTMLQK